MSRSKRSDLGSQATAQKARERVAAALQCAKVLWPTSDLRSKRKLAEEILIMAHGKGRPVPRKLISPAQVEEIIFRHMQCIYQRCPMLLFSKQLTEELNVFFEEE